MQAPRTDQPYPTPKTIRKAEEGLADRVRWREEIPRIPGIHTRFVPLFSFSTTCQKGDTILGDNFCCILSPFCRQPPPANPFSMRSSGQGLARPCPNDHMLPTAMADLTLGNSIDVTPLRRVTTRG